MVKDVILKRGKFLSETVSLNALFLLKIMGCSHNYGQVNSDFAFPQIRAHSDFLQTLLNHFYYLLSRVRQGNPVNTLNMSGMFEDKKLNNRYKFQKNRKGKILLKLIDVKSVEIGSEISSYC